ncbi:MAG TPA: VCBS repeat-containing protein [Candidatus Udaeobacter sp.]|nr:VCBS repeat-containing protein [Candidatus Udaeobacter sp.]
MSINNHLLFRFFLALLLLCLVSIQSAIALTDSKQTVVPVPLINQPLVPDAIAPGGGDFTLTVNGTGFARRSVVQWNGHNRATTFVSRQRLTAIIRASDVATANTGSITVVTSGGTSNVVYFPVTNATTSVSFSDTPITTAIEPTGCISGDFNEDGKIDFACSDYTSYTVNVLLGNGDGTFQPYVTYPTGTAPITIAPADFNEDGHVDLVTNGRGVVCILLGNGDGTFGPHRDFGAIPLDEGELKTADLNGDGHMDVVIGNYAYPSVSVFLGNGDGTLQSAVSYRAPHAALLVVGDYDQDGNLDLAVVGQSAVGILRGRGDGSFRQIGDYELGYLTGIATADFNGDGILDLACSDWNEDRIAILIGSGDGTFQSPVYYQTDRQPRGLLVGDLNGDGYLDLATSTYGTLSTLLGNRNGAFQPYNVHQVNASGGKIIADLNQDGRLDIATGYGILLQNATGDFSTRH